MNDTKQDKLNVTNTIKKCYRKIKNNKKKLLVLLFVLIAITSCVLITSTIYYHKQKEINCQNQKNPITKQDFIDKLSLDIEDKNVIALLTINSIGLEKAPVKDGTDMETLNQYIGHFKNSNYLDGNVAICSHNRGYAKNYFENLKNIKNGDEIIYETKYETKIYKVSEIKLIKETDVDVTYKAQENKITLITCVNDNPQNRLCVIGNQVN